MLHLYLVGLVDSSHMQGGVATIGLHVHVHGVAHLAVHQHVQEGGIVMLWLKIFSIAAAAGVLMDSRHAHTIATHFSPLIPQAMHRSGK